MKQQKDNWVKILFSFAAPCKGKMALSVFCAILSVAGGFIPFWAVYEILLAFINQNVTLNGILIWCLVGAVGYLLRVACHGISTIMAHISAYTILEGIRLKIADRLMKAPLGEVMGRRIGYLKNIIMDKVEDLEPPLAHMIPELTSNLLLPVAIFIWMLVIDWRMGLAVLIAPVLAMIPMFFLSDVCGGYRVLRALYNLSRIPERYRYTIALKPENGEDLEAFTTLDNYKNDVLSMVDEGRGLYIWGKSTGNGKTSWACKIMSYFFRKIAFNTGLENEGLYIFLPTFLEDLRDNYDNKDPEFDEILRMIKTCRLLIIDDIGAERVTDWVRERMVSIINTRVSNNLTTIYTSNLSPEELRGELGDRIASRVLGSSQVVEITSGDRRGIING